MILYTKKSSTQTHSSIHPPIIVSSDREGVLCTLCVLHPSFTFFFISHPLDYCATPIHIHYIQFLPRSTAPNFSIYLLLVLKIFTSHYEGAVSICVLFRYNTMWVWWNGLNGMYWNGKWTRMNKIKKNISEEERSRIVYIL